MKPSRILMLALVCMCFSVAEHVRAQWLEVRSPVPTSRLTDVVMLDSVTAIAVGREREILRTTDGGATWIDRGAPLSYGERWNGLSFFDSSRGVVVGDRGVVLTTDNGGRGWAWHQLPGGRTALSAVHVGPSAFYVGTDSGWIYHTADTGRTWTSEHASQYPIRSMFAWRGPYVLGLPVYALTPYSILMKTEFPSSAWSETVLQPFQGLGSEAYDGEFSKGGGPGFLVGVQGDLRAAPTVVRRALGDTVWMPSTSGIRFDGVLWGVSAPSEKVIYVCGSHGLLFRSADGGINWNLQTVATTKDLNAIYFFDAQRGIAVGDSGVILRTTNGGGMTSAPRGIGEVPSHFGLEQNYPNPFNPLTRIRYEVSERAQVRIDIVDVLGRHVALLTDSHHAPGRYSIVWDGKNSAGNAVCSGVYLCRMAAGRSFAAAVKLLLTR